MDPLYDGRDVGTSEGRHRRNGLGGHHQAVDWLYPMAMSKSPDDHAHSIWALTLVAGDINAGVRSDVLSADARVCIKVEVR